MAIEFFVPGTPRPQGSKRAFVRGNRAMMVESAGQPLKDWRAAVRLEAGYAMDDQDPSDPFAGPVEIKLAFRFVRPKSHLLRDGSLAKGRSEHHTIRPDIDKLVRAVLDAMTGVVWLDDSQVVAITASKGYGSRAGVWVGIKP